MRRLALVLAAVLVATACGSDPREGVLVERAREAAAMVPRPGGVLLYGELRTGRILTEEGEQVAKVEVATGGQRGLLGLTYGPDEETVFAAWTRASDRRIVVAAVAPGRQRLIWEGPPSADLANGGHLATSPEGKIVIGIGDLEDPGSVSDLSAPHGKIYALDPNGEADQEPEMISSSWNNPFAFTYTPSGALWVADNAPGNDRERLVRGDPISPGTVLPDRTAPSGLAAPDDDTLVVCGYATKLLIRYRIGGDGVPREDAKIATDCRFGVVALPDGRLAYATATQIKTLVEP